MQLNKTYREDINLLKGIAIIAVVLYHLGLVKSGYLGVDAFFVINGYFIIPKVVNEVSNNTFSYLKFLEKRVIRLLPLMLIVTGISLFVGYWTMLPDDYENLSESVIATNFFSNNILSSIQSNDYWATSNEYKPLMHTWYIGILFEFYVIFPFIVMIVKRISKLISRDFYSSIIIVLFCLTIISVVLYFIPSVRNGARFYFLQYRFFEIALGGLAGLLVIKRKRLYYNYLLNSISFLFYCFLLFFSIIFITENVVRYDLVTGNIIVGESLIPQNYLLILTVMFTVILIVSSNEKSRIINCLINLKFICLLGVMSYSLFLWHQPILAFYRYIVSNDISFLFIIIFLIFTIIISYFSYSLVEQKIFKDFKTYFFLLISFIVINAIAFNFYLHAGVVRDVHELCLKKDSVHRNMFAEYNDRIYLYDKDFPKPNNKINILLIGNSFARDMGNVLLESKVSNYFNLSYIYYLDNDNSNKYLKRIKEADLIFFFGWKHSVPNFVWTSIKSNAEVWGIGTKNYGECNGNIYQKRNEPDYLSYSVAINPNFILLNQKLKAEWKDKYIDFLCMSFLTEGYVRVFTEEGKFISQDCEHLTESGARYYASKINFLDILNNHKW